MYVERESACGFFAVGSSSFVPFPVCRFKEEWTEKDQKCMSWVYGTFTRVSRFMGRAWDRQRPKESSWPPCLGRRCMFFFFAGAFGCFLV